MTDPIIQRIEMFQCPRGKFVAERRNPGYTLYHAQSGHLIARLRPTAQDDHVEVLYWSLWEKAWIRGEPLGRTHGLLPADASRSFRRP